jgi:hypothetical protein
LIGGVPVAEYMILERPLDGGVVEPES